MNTAAVQQSKGIGLAHFEQWHCPRWATALLSVSNGSAHGGQNNRPFLRTLHKKC